jgi:hypothetical protein
MTDLIIKDSGGYLGEYQINGRMVSIYKLYEHGNPNFGFFGIYKDVLGRKWTSGLIRINKEDAVELGSKDTFKAIINTIAERLNNGLTEILPKN